MQRHPSGCDPKTFRIDSIPRKPRFNSVRRTQHDAALLKLPGIETVLRELERLAPSLYRNTIPRGNLDRLAKELTEILVRHINQSRLQPKPVEQSHHGNSEYLSDSETLSLRKRPRTQAYANKTNPPIDPYSSSRSTGLQDHVEQQRRHRRRQRSLPNEESNSHTKLRCARRSVRYTEEVQADNSEDKRVQLPRRSKDPLKNMNDDLAYKYMAEAQAMREAEKLRAAKQIEHEKSLAIELDSSSDESIEEMRIKTVRPKLFTRARALKSDYTSLTPIIVDPDDDTDTETCRKWNARRPRKTVYDKEPQPISRMHDLVFPFGSKRRLTNDSFVNLNLMRRLARKGILHEHVRGVIHSLPRIPVNLLVPGGRDVRDFGDSSLSTATLSRSIAALGLPQPCNSANVSKVPISSSQTGQVQLGLNVGLQLKQAQPKDIPTESLDRMIREALTVAGRPLCLPRLKMNNFSGTKESARGVPPPISESSQAAKPQHIMNAGGSRDITGTFRNAQRILTQREQERVQAANGSSAEAVRRTNQQRAQTTRAQQAHQARNIGETERLSAIQQAAPNPQKLSLERENRMGTQQISGHMSLVPHSAFRATQARIAEPYQAHSSFAPPLNQSGQLVTYPLYPGQQHQQFQQVERGSFLQTLPRQLPAGKANPQPPQQMQDAIHQSALQQQVLHQQVLHQQALHQQALHQQALQQQALQQQAIQQQAIQQQAIRQQAMRQQALQQQALRQQALRQQALRQQALQQQALQQQALRQQSLQQQAQQQQAQQQQSPQHQVLQQQALQQQALQQQAFQQQAFQQQAFQRQSPKQPVQPHRQLLDLHPKRGHHERFDQLLGGQTRHRRSGVDSAEHQKVQHQQQLQQQAQAEYVQVANRERYPPMYLTYPHQFQEDGQQTPLKIPEQNLNGALVPLPAQLHESAGHTYSSPCLPNGTATSLSSCRPEATELKNYVNSQGEPFLCGTAPTGTGSSTVENTSGGRESSSRLEGKVSVHRHRNSYALKSAPVGTELRQSKSGPVLATPSLPAKSTAPPSQTPHGVAKPSKQESSSSLSRGYWPNSYKVNSGNEENQISANASGVGNAECQGRGNISGIDARSDAATGIGGVTSQPPNAAPTHNASTRNETSELRQLYEQNYQQQYALQLQQVMKKIKEKHSSGGGSGGGSGDD